MKWIVHPGAEAWLPDDGARATLDRAFPGPSYVVHLWPRAEANAVLGHPKPPYAFRAFTRGSESHVFVDPTETPRSIAWLVGHELGHQALARSPAARSPLREARPMHLDPAGDAFHDVDPEERFCDDVATGLFGYTMNRRWWRARTPRFEGYGAASPVGPFVQHPVC